jgi:hypothetical protein
MKLALVPKLYINSIAKEFFDEVFTDENSDFGFSGF